MGTLNSIVNQEWTVEYMLWPDLIQSKGSA